MPLNGRILKKLRALHQARLRDFGRDDRAATAIEFGILALPFFALIGAILETAVVFLASQIFDSAVQDASRLVRTGQAANFDVAAFNTQVCNELVGLFDCTKLRTEVTPVTNFASANFSASPLDPDHPEQWKLQPSFDPGIGSQVMMVRVYYKWPVVLNFWGFSLATSPDGTHLMSAVRVFTNEPFTGG
jgi:Flp pilus assembly protein TadG